MAREPIEIAERAAADRHDPWEAKGYTSCFEKMGELLLTVFIVVLLWGGRFPRVGLCTVTGFTFWASFDTGSRVVLSAGAIDTTTVAALLVLVMLGGLFPSMDVFAIFEDRTLEPAISPKYALITLAFLVAGLATGALASTAWRA